MIPILMSIAGAIAGKAVVSAYEWATSDDKKPGSVTKSDVRGTGFTPEASKVTISPEAQRMMQAAKAGSLRHDPTQPDPTHMSPRRLAKLADQLKSSGQITASDHDLLLRVAVNAHQSDLVAGKGNTFLGPRNMVTAVDQQAAASAKAGNSAEATQYQKLAILLKNLNPKTDTGNA